MPRLAFAFSAAIFLIALGSRHANAQAVDFFVADILNTDTVVNLDADPPTPFDEDNDPVGNLGTNYAFVSQSAAAASGCSFANGLPDDGFFPANADHPDVHLPASGGSGLNTRRSNGGDIYSFGPLFGEPDHFTAVHLFLASGDGNTTVTAILTYTDLTSSVYFLTVPNWLHDAVPPAYYLFNGQGIIGPDPLYSFPPCFDGPSPAIFGYNLPADPTRSLGSVRIERLDDTTAVLNFFGATGMLPVPVTLERFTVD